MQPHPIGLRRPTAAGYYFSVLRKQHGFPAVRKSSPNVTEEAGEIAQQLNDLVDVAMTEDDISQGIINAGDRLANNLLARNARAANLG